MRSYIEKLADLSSAAMEPMEVELSKSEMEEEAAREISNLCYLNKHMENVPVVEKGDIVSLALVSENPKYNKKRVFVNVGKNLFSKELEEKLISHKADDSFIAAIGNTNVNITILSAQRTVVPEISDEMIQKEGIEGVSTVEQYREYRKKLFYEMTEDAYMDFYADEIYRKQFDESATHVEQDELQEWIRVWADVQKAKEEAHNMVFSEDLEEFAAEDAEVFFRYAMGHVYLKDINPNEFDLLYDEQALLEYQKTVLSPIKEKMRPYFTLKVTEGEEDGH